MRNKEAKEKVKKFVNALELLPYRLQARVMRLLLEDEDVTVIQRDLEEEQARRQYERDVENYNRHAAYLNDNDYPFGLPPPQWLVAKGEMMLELEQRIQNYKLRYPDYEN